MAKKRLTDRALKALKPRRQRYDLMDTDVPGFGVRVSEKGQRTFILIARYPGSSNPARRAVGEYPTVSLEKARRRAREWRHLIEKGVDPKADEARLRREELRKHQTTFAAVAEDFIERHIKGQRKARDTEREIRNELIAELGERPITSITREDVVILVEAVAVAQRLTSRTSSLGTLAHYSTGRSTGAPTAWRPLRVTGLNPHH